MGRLSTFAKNRILNLRFQKCYRIKQIAQTLIQEDNIKVSRKSISTFLKKYIETKSINDKPRSGRNKKLTPEEINLIGEVTRLNRDITAPKIKEYLNLNVSTYTILRASKLFEWNKLNPNSNQAKREAALQRQKATTDEPSETEIKLPTCSSSTAANVSTSRSSSSRRRKAASAANAALLNTSGDEEGAANGMSSCGEDSINLNTSINESKDIKYEPLPPEANLNVIPEEEILLAKNVSSSPMVFTTKMLYKLFRLDELIGHNVSGKTFNKFIKNKKALDERRVNYIRYLVERHYSDEETPDLSREELWKACRTAINKSIRNNEIKMAAAAGVASTTNPADLALLTNLTPGATTGTENTVVKLNNDLVFMEDGQILMRQQQQQPRNSVNKSRDEAAETAGLLNLEPNMTIVQITNDLPPSEAEQEAAVAVGGGPATSVAASTVNSQYFENNSELISSHGQSTVIQLTSVSSVDFSSSPIKTYADLSSSQIKMDYQDSYPSASGANSMDYVTSGNNHQLGSEGASSSESATNPPFELLTESEILDMRARFTSPMIFATKILTRIFTKDQLVGHNLSTKNLIKSGSKSAGKQQQQQQQPTLDEDRINYIKSLIEKYYINSPAGGSGSSSSSAVPSTRSGGASSKKNLDDVWISCRKAINRVIRNFEIKESKLIKSIETDIIEDEEQDDDETEEEEPPQQQQPEKNNVVNTRPNTRASRYRAARS